MCNIVDVSPSSVLIYTNSRTPCRYCVPYTYMCLAHQLDGIVYQWCDASITCYAHFLLNEISSSLITLPYASSTVAFRVGYPTVISESLDHMSDSSEQPVITWLNTSLWKLLNILNVSRNTSVVLLSCWQWCLKRISGITAILLQPVFSPLSYFTAVAGFSAVC